MTETTFSLAQILPAMPEIYLTAAVCVLLVFDVFFGLQRPARTASFTLLILLGGALVTLLTADFGHRQSIFDGMYVADDLATLLKLAAFLFVAVAMYYSNEYLARRRIQKGEYYVLSLTALLGILVLTSASNLITIYVGVELLSLSLYALVAFDRDSGIAAESAMKYFVLGAIASGALLYGISMVYGVTGSLRLDEIAVGVSEVGASQLGLVFGLAFIVVGVAFKFGAVPFHMWLPDVYHGAPTPVTLFIGSAPKIASFALAIRVLAEGLGGMVGGWQDMLVVLAALSMGLGNVVAISQTNLKRMLAYSTISHVGFILLGFVAGTATGYQAAMYYTLTYVIMALGGFGMILLLSRDGFESDRLEDFKGLAKKSPWFALVMLMLMFSMAGVPPFVGFWAKIGVIGAVVDKGYTWLAGIAVFFSVIGAFYYLRVIKLMYFDEPTDVGAIEAGGSMRFVLSANGLAVLALGVFPSVLLDLCIRVLQ